MAKDPRDKQEQSGMSRRGFLGTAGAGVLGAVVLKSSAAAQSASEGAAGNRITLSVNGESHTLTVEPRWTLLFVIREKLGLTGPKTSCGSGECGACTVLIDGETRYACMTLAVEAQGRQITTVEGLMQGEELGPVQKAFVKEDGFQCGYCTPGQVMAAEALLRKNPNPTLDQIREGMSGNLCRCGAYDHIFKSVQTAAKLKKGGAA